MHDFGLGERKPENQKETPEAPGEHVTSNCAQRAEAAKGIVLNSTYKIQN